MADQKILNQDEIDALIHGVDRGAVSTEPAAARLAKRAITTSQPDAHRARPHADARDDQRALRAPVSHQPLQSAAPHARDRGAADADEEVQRVRAVAARADEPESREDQSAAGHRPVRARPEAGVRDRSTTSSAATAGTPRSKAASSPPPRSASSTWCCKHASPTCRKRGRRRADRRRVPALRDQSAFREHRHARRKSWWSASFHDRARRRRRRRARHDAVLHDRAAARNAGRRHAERPRRARRALGSARSRKRSRTPKSSSPRCWAAAASRCSS